MSSTTETPHEPHPVGRGSFDDTIDIVRQLWPAPHVVSAVGPGLTAQGLAVLPNRRRPTRLVPDRAGRAGARALVGTVHGHGAAAAVRHTVLYAGASLGLLRLAPSRLRVWEAPGAASILSHLGEALAEPVTASIHLGPPRANRKPVLHLVGRSGRTVAYAKIGINDLTRPLVSGEADALRALAAAGLRRVRVPRVAHAGTWQDLQVLCLSPVGTRTALPVPTARLAQAMVEVAAALGTESTTVGSSPHLRSLRESARSTTSRHGPALLAAVDRLVAHCGDVVLPTGTWHGDWTPWNMGFDDDELSVWDWERLQTGVPLGLDALHFAVQRAMRVPGSQPSLVAREQLAARRTLLAPWGYDALRADVVSAVYLLTIGGRYAADGQEEAGARLGRLGDWLFPTLETLLPPTTTGPPA